MYISYIYYSEQVPQERHGSCLLSHAGGGPARHLGHPRLAVPVSTRSCPNCPKCGCFGHFPSLVWEPPAKWDGRNTRIWYRSATTMCSLRLLALHHSMLTMNCFSLCFGFCCCLCFCLRACVCVCAAPLQTFGSRRKWRHCSQA